MAWTFVFLLCATFSLAVFGSLVGGRTPVELSKDKGAQKALKLVVPELKRMNSCAPGQVVKVEKQVVAGIMYYITVRMMKTCCSKTSAHHQCLFPMSANSETKFCTFKVWFRPWLKNRKVLLLHPECHGN